MSELSRPDTGVGLNKHANNSPYGFTTHARKRANMLPTAASCVKLSSNAVCYVAEAEWLMLRDHSLQYATCAKWAHDAERCCMVCELHHSGVLQGGLQAIQQRVCCAD